MAMMSMPAPVFVSPVTASWSAAIDGHAALKLAAAMEFRRGRPIMHRDYDRPASSAWHSVTF
jgi:hypothetical protein